MKKILKSWEELQKEYEAMQGVSCVPSNIFKVKPDYIFDENKSVKWNKAQVESNNEQYLKEVARLNTEKNKFRDSIYEDVLYAIIIWNLAYEEGHAFGFNDIQCHLQNLIELADKLSS